jgi:hypothetical protein
MSVIAYVFIPLKVFVVQAEIALSDSPVIPRLSIAELRVNRIYSSHLSESVGLYSCSHSNMNCMGKRRVPSLTDCSIPLAVQGSHACGL